MNIDVKEKIEQIGLDYARLSRLYRIKNKDFSIISNNCCGSLIYRLLELKKLSPTQDLIVERKNFPVFCRNLKYYLRLPVDVPTEEERSTRPSVSCPVGILHAGPELPDVFLTFLHYDSFEQATDAWYRRRERVNYDNLFFLMDCGMEATEELLDEFERLPSPNKVVFTHLQDKKRWKHTFRFGYYTEKEYKPARMFRRRWRWPFLYLIMDEFPYIKWLNHGVRGDFL